MSDSINSLSPDFRDFLLNRNLVTDTVTDNGLDALLTGIGVPMSMIGTPPESVQPSEDIVDGGGFYKDLNLITNKFQGTDDDYTLTSIEYIPNYPTTNAVVYSVGYVDDDGILNDTLNTPANGAFAGGDIRQFNTSKNLYDDPSKQLLVDLDSVTMPNVKYTNYKDLNADIINKEVDVLGTILGGGQVGLNTNGGLESNFDLRSTLLGRILGGTGVISDTPIGQAGAKYLGLAMANNASFGLQQETLGKFNLNPLNIAKNGIKGIIVPNYNITVPSGGLGKVLDFGARVLGFESPISLYEKTSSIFTSENPVSNIERANAQIANTGKGQVLALFSNIKSNTFKPGFIDKRVSNRGEGDDGMNPNIYTFGTVDGQVIDFLNTGNSINTPISQSNYRRDTMIEDSGFNGVEGGLSSPLDSTLYMADGGGKTGFSWADDKDNKDAQQIFSKDTFNSPNSILTKTQRLFNSGKMKTLVSGRVSTGNEKSQAPEEALRTGGMMSKGSGVLSEDAVSGNFSDANNVFCRTWTTFNKYNKVENLQKHSGISETTAYRNTQSISDSVLGDNGFVRIAPTIGENEVNSFGETNIKNYMFSIENLAWADNHADLITCELGPGDLMTGKRGRIMWFPPYDLSVTENVAVNWETTNFIGRGEPVYTYNNTERIGTLSFKVIVDHPSYVNAMKGDNGNSDDYIASFFAGCTDIDPLIAEKLTTTERDMIENQNIVDISKKTPQEEEPSIKSLEIYLPNDVSIPDPTYEDKSEETGGGLNTTIDSGTVSIVKSTSTDRNDFGLNGDKNPTLGDVGGWITPAGVEKLKKVLNEECPACKIETIGYASHQGEDINPKGNQEIIKKRANELRKWLEDNVLKFDQNIIDEKITYNDRFTTKNGEVIGCENIKKGNNDEYCLKVSRKAVANFNWDGDLALKLTGNEKDPIETPPEQARVSNKIVNRFYNECNYFEKIRAEDSFVYDTMRQRLKYFHPSFHSVTPEGLNSRLTFLQQCTRQGPTLVSGKPTNLAFGRPPVCILRLGDFYHSKVVFDNISISYEPLVWDLNPEGIGVQPMIAHVDLSYKMIGGHSMKGPINKLQNALSFNFFGNTEVYDVRAERIAKSKRNNETTIDDNGNMVAGGNYDIVAGESPKTKWGQLMEESKVEGINNTAEIDQEGMADKANNNTEQDPVTGVKSDKLILQMANYEITNTASVVGGKITLNWDSTVMNTLTKKYNFKVSINIDNGFKSVIVGELGPNSPVSSVTSDTNNWSEMIGDDASSSPLGYKYYTIKIEFTIPSESNVVKNINMVGVGKSCPTVNVYKGKLLKTTSAEFNQYITNC